MFNDIFSKNTEKKRPIKRVKILADIHEKDSEIFAELKSDENIDLEIASLKIGDYLIGDIIIERKTVEDFTCSMMSKRLFEQLKQMKIYEKRLLILEGKEENMYKNEKINPNAIRGFILSILNYHNTQIIFTLDKKDTAKYLIILTKQQEKNVIKSSLHSRIPRTIEEQKRYVLESFPNIGPKKADLLLKKFSSLKDIFNAPEEELKEILKNRVMEFKKILGTS